MNGRGRRRQILSESSQLTPWTLTWLGCWVDRPLSPGKNSREADLRVALWIGMQREDRSHHVDPQPVLQWLVLSLVTHSAVWAQRGLGPYCILVTPRLGLSLTSYLFHWGLCTISKTNGDRKLHCNKILNRASEAVPSPVKLMAG